jgi:2-phospho-L-lactate guanylyltransferase
VDRDRAPVTRAILVPVKAFASAKARLASVLDDAARAALARRLAEGVVRAAAASLPVAVVCDDEEVAAWADGAGALVIRQPGEGLNGAVAAGVRQLAVENYDLVAVVHADLARPAGIADLVTSAEPSTVMVVPDRREDGTNVLVVPADAGFRFGYGPGSFRRHVSEAERLGLDVNVVRDTPYAFDVDVPADLGTVAGAEG